MLFAGEDGVKKMRVLSGGEKVRVLLSRMMIVGSNVLTVSYTHLDVYKRQEMYICSPKSCVISLA